MYERYEGLKMLKLPLIIKFDRFYFSLFITFFIIEVLIALYVNDNFIRPYLGDTFVVILIYCFIRSFFNVPTYPAIIAVLVFSYTIEILQYFKLVELLGLGDYTLARIVIGTSFAWGDLVAYTAGAIIVVTFDSFTLKGNKN